jgi:uncharacterized protein (DUF433 family)
MSPYPPIAPATHLASILLIAIKRYFCYKSVELMETKQNYQDRIIVNPEILVGKPVVKGTRIPVELVLERLEEDTNTKLLFEDYPQLTSEDIKACLWYAKELVKGEEVYPAPYSHTV